MSKASAQPSTSAAGDPRLANPVAVAVPCHRVVRRDGDLSGYRGGVERKRVLLQRENALTRRRDEGTSPLAAALANQLETGG